MTDVKRKDPLFKWLIITLNDCMIKLGKMGDESLEGGEKGGVDPAEYMNVIMDTAAGIEDKCTELFSGKKTPADPKNSEKDETKKKGEKKS